MREYAIGRFSYIPMIRSDVLITLIPSTISFKILNKNGLPTTLFRYFKEKTKKFPKIFGYFKNSLYLCTLVIKEISGLTGFDGEMKWYVSTRSLVGYLHNHSGHKI